MSDASSGTVGFTLSSDGMVGTITLDRAAKLNALTPEMLGALVDACAEAGGSGARAVLLRTGGQRVFSVGADINRFAGLDPVTMWRDWVAAGHRAFAALATLPQPTIAVVDGPAYGGGFELALAADFRVLDAGATLALPETGLGTVPGWGGTERLTRLVGPHRAKEVILTRRILTPDEALKWGIATLVAQPGRLSAAVDALLAPILAGAPTAMQLAKQIITAADQGAPSAVLEALASGIAVATSDLAEGVAAFREKREAVFTGS